MRKFLVVLDDTRECLNAIRYAALRAAATGGSVQVLAVIPAEVTEVRPGDPLECLPLLGREGQ